MIVGKTSSSISKDEIFSKFTETQILSAVFPEITSLPHRMCSPLRNDKHPSFSIYMTDGGHVAWKDFGSNGERGGLMDLLCKYWHCTFQQALNRIWELPAIKDSDVTLKAKQIKTITKREASTLTKIQVVVRPWRDYDLEYWESYGISKKWLVHAEVYPISYKIVTKKKSEDDRGKQYIFPAQRLAYCYVERKEGKVQLKIYQPLDTKGFKWCSSMDASVISLWTKVPEYGDRIVICSSLKDALCLSAQTHIPAIAPQGEAYDMSETAISELKRRYGKVYVCYDTDAPGKADAVKFCERTGFINIVPDLGTEKDLSDAYRKYGKQWFVEHIKPLFN